MTSAMLEMTSRKYTTAYFMAGIIATLTIAALASISFSTAAFAQGGGKSPACTQIGTAGTGNPHDFGQTSGNPHDSDFSTGNPHDACRGS